LPRHRRRKYVSPVQRTERSIRESRNAALLSSDIVTSRQFIWFYYPKCPGQPRMRDEARIALDSRAW